MFCLWGIIFFNIYFIKVQCLKREFFFLVNMDKEVELPSRESIDIVPSRDEKTGKFSLHIAPREEKKQKYVHKPSPEPVLMQEGKKGWRSAGVIALVVILALAGVYFIPLGIVGYNVYQQIQGSNLTVEEYGQNVRLLTSDLDRTKVNLSAYSQFNTELQGKVNTLSDELTTCKVEKEKTSSDLTHVQQTSAQEKSDFQKQVSDKEAELQAEREKAAQEIEQKVAERTLQLDQEKASCLTSLEEKQAEVDAKESTYAAFAKTMARSVCCKERVDNPKISSYNIVDDKIVCLESGGEAIQC